MSKFSPINLISEDKKLLHTAMLPEIPQKDSIITVTYSSGYHDVYLVKYIIQTISDTRRPGQLVNTCHIAAIVEKIDDREGKYKIQKG